jgi:hypothetical protein
MAPHRRSGLRVSSQRQGEILRGLAETPQRSKSDVASEIAALAGELVKLE